MADEYIRRQDAADAVNRWLLDVFGTQKADNSIGIIRMLEELEPADVAPVVRCRDCKYNSSTHKCLNPDSFF